MHIFRKNNGGALVLVLMVFSCVIILGSTITAVSYSENRQSIVEEKRLKAYYTARSAADSTAEWLVDTANLDNVTNVVPDDQGEAYAVSGTGNLENTGFTVKVTKDDANIQLVYIEAISNIDGTQGKAALTIHESGVYSGTAPFDNTIFASNNVTLTGNTYVDGGIEAGGIIDANSNVTITGTQKEHSSRDFPPWVMNETLVDADPYNLDIKNNESLVISSNARYGIIQVRNGGTLTFMTGSTELVVMADTLDFDGTINVQGTGKLKLYVNSYVDIGGSVISTPGSLIIYLATGSSMKLPGNTTFNGFVYGPEATVDLNGTPGFTGAIIAETVTGVGTSNLYYAQSEAQSIDATELQLVRFTRGSWFSVQ
jgi:hypothetical protein